MAGRVGSLVERTTGGSLTSLARKRERKKSEVRVCLQVDTQSWLAGGRKAPVQYDTLVAFTRINGKCSREGGTRFGSHYHPQHSQEHFYFYVPLHRATHSQLCGTPCAPVGGHRTPWAQQAPAKRIRMRAQLMSSLSLPATCCWWTLLHAIVSSLSHAHPSLLMISITCSERGKGEVVLLGRVQQWILSLPQLHHEGAPKWDDTCSTLADTSNPFHSIAHQNNTSRPTGGS